MLLDFYRALYEKSSDAVYAFSGALHNHYRRRGFPLQTTKVPTSVFCVLAEIHVVVGSPDCRWI
jgi:hypothetical protein